MITFKQFVAEAFDKPYEYELRKRQTGYVGEFVDDAGKDVFVNFVLWPAPEVVQIDFDRDGEWEMTNDSPEDRNQGIRIMATVLAIINEVIPKMNASDGPAKFALFSAKSAEKGRVSLYNRLVKKFASSMGYEEIKTIDQIDHKIMPGWYRNFLAGSVEARANTSVYTLLGQKSVIKS